MIGSDRAVDIYASMTDIWKSWQAFRRGKSTSQSILWFESRLEHNLLNLVNQINNQEYKHGFYEHMVVHDPKRREIAVASVLDRIVHRYVYDQLVSN